MCQVYKHALILIKAIENINRAYRAYSTIRCQSVDLSENGHVQLILFFNSHNNAIFAYRIENCRKVMTAKSAYEHCCGVTRIRGSSTTMVDKWFLYSV